MRLDQGKRDLTHPRVFFHRAVRISSASIFFTPKMGESLNFQTIFSAPKAHREVLQKNGIIAKVMLSVSSSSLVNFGTPESRMGIWWKTLLNSGLVQSDPSSVSPPAGMENELWPIIDETTFTTRINVATGRWMNETLRECPFIVPVLSVEQFVYKERDVIGVLGVIWMPNYPCNLQQWNERDFSRRFVPESTLCTLINQLIIALLELGRSGNPSTACFFMEDVLVTAITTEDEPSFVLNTLDFEEEERCQPQLFVADGYDVSSSLYPFFPPELTGDENTPFKGANYNVWSLGMIVFHIVSWILPTGRKVSDTISCILRKNAEVPLNHASLTPSDVIRRVRRVLKPGLYSNPFIHILLFMLAQDPLTRPTLRVLDRMMQGLLCQSILRFPFAIGSFDLLRVPNPQTVLIDPIRGLYVTKAECVLCKRRHIGSKVKILDKNKCNIRCHSMCASVARKPAVCSPIWSTDELLPGYVVARNNHMSYLYPLLGNSEVKEKRQCIEAALNDKTIDSGALLQLFGGFAVLQAVDRTRLVTREVLVPIPSNVLCKREKGEVVTTLSFTAALPWPSQCTSQLQQTRRIQRAAPALFSIRNVYWYAWILPGETFLVGESTWMPAADGAFVFWFSEDLAPSEEDRYFLVCSVQSLTLPAKVEITTLPDHALMRGKSTWESLYFSHSEIFVVNASERGSAGHRRSRLLGSAFPRRRSTIASVVDFPCAGEVEVVNAAQEYMSEWHFNSPAVVPESLDGENICNSVFSRRNRPLKRYPALRMDCIDNLTCKQIHMPQINKRDEAKLTLTEIVTSEHLRDLKREDKDKKSNMQKINHGPVSINQELPELVDISPIMHAGNTRRGRKQSRSFHDDVTQIETHSRDVDIFPLMPTVSPKKTTTVTATPTPGVLDVISPRREIRNSCLISSNTPQRIFGRWYESRYLDAVDESLSFCIPETGKHGPLSCPEWISDEMRCATHTPSSAVSMTFCANEVSAIRRNYPQDTAALSPSEASSIIPHPAMVFHDAEPEHGVVGF